MSRLRAGCLDLEIETGRWRGVQRENRICKLCSDGIETEIHFLFHCCSLEHIRESFYDILSLNKEAQCDNDRFEILCGEMYVLLAN